VFAWFEDRASADSAAPRMRKAFEDAGFPAESFISPVDGPAAGLLD
jgi:homoserine kinase